MSKVDDSIVAVERENAALRQELQHIKERLEALKSIVYREHELEEGEAQSRLWYAEVAAVGPIRPLIDSGALECVTVKGDYDLEKYFVACIACTNIVAAGIECNNVMLLQVDETLLDNEIMLCYDEGRAILKNRQLLVSALV